MLLFIQLFLLTVITVTASFLIGLVIIRTANVLLGEEFFALFFTLSLGLSVITCIYSVVATRGSTVQLLMLILMGGLVVTMRKNIDIVNSHSRHAGNTYCTGATKLPLLCVILSIVFLIQYLLIYDPSSEYLQTPFQDYVYYSRLTLPLNTLGLETNSLEAIFPQFLTEQPYHYLETWLNALLVKVTGLPSVWVYFVSVSSVFITVICAGFMAIFAHFKFNSFWTFVFALSFLFVTGIRWIFLQQYTFVLNGALLSSLILCLNPKLTPVYLYILLGVNFLLKRQYVATGIGLAVLPITFISTTPVMGIAVAFLAAYLFIFRKLSWIKSVYVLLPIAASTVYIILFYTLQPEPYQFPSTGRAFALKSIIPSIGEIKTLINIAIGVLANYTIYFFAYGVLIVLILLLRRQRRLLFNIPSEIIFWFGANLIMAAIMRAFGTHFLDSFQFFSNTMVPLSPVILAVVIGAILQGASKRLYGITIGALSILALFNFSAVGAGNTKYSPVFMKQVAEIAPQLGSRGGFVLADEDYENAYMLSPDSYTTGNYISNFKNNYAFTSLSELDVDSLTTDPRFERDSAQAEQIVRKSSFYRYVKFQALQKRSLSLDSAKYEFVTKHNISFVCVSKRATLPAVLNPLVNTVLTDSLSGERLYILRTNNKSNYLNAYDN